MIDDPDVHLMLRFQNGDESAFRQLFEKYKLPLLNFIFRYCQDRRIAEELSQEVFIRVYKTSASYRPDAMFSTWIYRIAINICLNEMRTGKYKYEIELKSIDCGEGEKFPEAVDQTTYIKTDDRIAGEESFKKYERHSGCFRKSSTWLFSAAFMNNCHIKKLENGLGALRQL